MAEVSLNMFDLGVLIIVGLSALLSFYRGFFSEVLSLASWLVASYIALRFAPFVTQFIAPHIKSEQIAFGIASVGLFFTSLILISIATGMLLKFLKPAAKVGLFDNLMGLCFGAARGILIVAVGYFILSIVMVEKDYPAVVKQSVSRPYIAQVSKTIATFAPSYLDSLDGKGKKKPAAAETGGTPKVIYPDSKNDSSIPSLEDLQKRIHEENEKNNVR
ncbi:MAG: CvpA family protein [Pseudomonadota bacterium]